MCVCWLIGALLSIEQQQVRVQHTHSHFSRHLLGPDTRRLPSISAGLRTGKHAESEASFCNVPSRNAMSPLRREKCVDACDECGGILVPCRRGNEQVSPQTSSSSSRCRGCSRLSPLPCTTCHLSALLLASILSSILFCSTSILSHERSDPRSGATSQPQ